MKKNKKLFHGIIITIWIIGFICMALMISGFIINRKSSKENDIKNNSSSMAKTTEINFLEPKTYEIKLGEKNVDIIVSGKTESPNRELTINNQKIDIPLEYADKLYVINEEVVLIVQSAVPYSYLYFYDENLKYLDVNLQLDKDDVMKPYIVVAKDNNILIQAHNEVVMKNFGDVSRICKNENINEYKDQLFEARYVIEYLGKGKFTKPKQEGKFEYIYEYCEELEKQSKNNSADASINSAMLKKRESACGGVSYWLEENTESKTFTIKVDPSDKKTAILTVNYDSEYAKSAYKELNKSGTEEYRISFEKNIRQAYIGIGATSNGAGNETAFYLLEDKSVEFTPLSYALGYNSYKYTNRPINIKSYGEVSDEVVYVNELFRGGFAENSPCNSSGPITLGQRDDTLYYDLSYFLEKTPYYK